MKIQNYNLKQVLVCGFFLSALIFSANVSAQVFDNLGMEISAHQAAYREELITKSSQELVPIAWEAAGQKNFEKLDAVLNIAQEVFGFEAQQLHYELDNFPSRDRIDEYQVLNDVATIMFIKGESLMHRGEAEKAKEAFQEVVDQYQWAQAWDPSRGQYWSIKEKSEASICMMTEGCEQKQKAKKAPKGPQSTIRLSFSGSKGVIDYSKYGRFENEGTTEYKFVMTDKKGLAKAVGQGIFPSSTAKVLKDPVYKNLIREGRLEGTHWDFIHTEDLQAAFYKWIMAPEAWGVKMFYIAGLFEKSEMWLEAIKTYYALVVHFPNTTAWTYWQTPWYPAQAAIGKIKHLVREHPELGIVYHQGKIHVANSMDNETANDEFTVSPGRLEQVGLIDRAKSKFGLNVDKVDLGEPVRKLGNGRVHFVQYENSHWQMIVEGKPFMIQGVMYAPTKVGQSPDQGTLGNWMTEDTNQNGLPDGPYDAWVDKNWNNIQDADEPAVGDFVLMEEMGVNTIRLYHHPEEPHKDTLRKMYKDHGIMVIIGDFLGKYTLGSGATWFEGTDYENEEHKATMMESVRQMVMEHKDEPYLLMWALGNENNYGVACNADKKPEAYFAFANEVAKMIKELDPNHPVSIVNGDVLFLDKYAEFAPDIDVFSSNVYRGDYGFGSFWDQVKEATDKPTFIKEFGAPAYGHHMTLKQAEEAQAAYHRGNWFNILENSAGYPNGAGNSIGGVVFQYLDEWWKNYEPALHDTETEVIGPFPGGYYFEEWFGIIGQGNGKNSPFLRQPREAYYTYKNIWNK